MDASASARAAALASYDILDTPDETAFDGIVKVASLVCGMPVSLISLLDTDRQWFKAEVGFHRRQTPLAQSICAHAVEQSGLFVIPDTTRDARTADNPLVTGDPHVRFYAGVPLETSDGVALGTLCVLDTKPNRLTDDQAFTLRTLAGQVMTQLELGRALKQRRDSDRRNAAILESAIDYGILALDLDGSVTSWTPGAERLMQWRAREMLGRPADAIFTREDIAAGVPEKEMRSALLHGRGVDERWHVRKDDSLFWASGEIMPLRDDGGAPLGFVKILRDRTEQRRIERALAESEHRWRSLFKEMSEGFFIGEIIRDARGRAFDYRFVDINRSFAEQSGLPADSVGRTIRSFVPDIQDWLIDNYARTVDTGEPQTFEIHVPGLHRFFEVRAQKEAGERFSCLFLDITARREAEMRRAALTELGDRLRAVTEKAEIGLITGEILGRTFDLSRAGYGEVDQEHETITIAQDWAAPGLDSIAGTLKFRAYGSYVDELKAGTAVLIEDVTVDARTASDSASLTAIGVRALANLPIMERGRFVTLFFALKGEPHAWTDEEVRILRDVADRARAAIARIEAEEQQRVLNLELAHRMKNMLAMVQAIATQTMRNASDLASAREALAARLLALSKSHDLLLGGSIDSTTMRSLIVSAVELHRDAADRFHLEGPDLPVGPKAAMSLSLMLHELATNAAKYGALSCPDGRVTIRWGTSSDGEADPHFRLEWVETGGPGVVPPARTGFGTRLIGRGLASNFNGEARLAYPPTGVTCTIRAPVSGLRAEDAPTHGA